MEVKAKKRITEEQTSYLVELMPLGLLLGLFVGSFLPVPV